MPPTLSPASDKPATGPWKLTEPSSQVVQQHYVNARVREINSNFGDRYREETIDALLTDYAAEIKGQSRAHKRKYCETIYDVITKTLQGRDLTINLKAESWFSVENPYETYAQMYERALDPATGGMFLTDSDPLNPAKVRARADDRITFPKHWGKPSGPAERGLAPGIQPFQSITSRMLTGAKIPKYAATPTNDTYLTDAVKADGSAAYKSKNPKFNARAKQIFSALNYGRRPHGSSTQYGDSYFVLNPSLKVDAIYFAGDTFFIPGADSQVSYKTLGALYLKAKGDLRRLLVNSCLSNIRLEDTANAAELVEAHIFSQLRFATGVSELHLEATDNKKIVKNAEKFCRKWGIRLVQSS